MNAAARTSIDTLLTTLKERLAEPGQSVLPLLGTMSRFSKYSLANQMLIFAQRPDATHVCGYRAWNKAGYQVRKGERGIAIYAPMLFANKRDTAAESDTDAAPRLGYRVAYVFDIAQVAAIAGTDAAAVTVTPVDTGEAFASARSLGFVHRRRPASVHFMLIDILDEFATPA